MPEAAEGAILARPKAFFSPSAYKVNTFPQKSARQRGEKETPTDIFSQKAARTEEVRHKEGGQPAEEPEPSCRMGGERGTCHALARLKAEPDCKPRPETQCAAMADAMRCDGRCCALRWPMHRTALSTPPEWVCRLQPPPSPMLPSLHKKTARWNPPRSTFHLSLSAIHFPLGTLMPPSGHRPPPVPATPWRYGAQHAACPH